MSWATEALSALRKIITLEERVGTLADDMREISQIIKELDRRVVRLETKFEVYERLSDKGRTRRLPHEE